MAEIMIVDSRYADIAKTAWGHLWEIVPSVACDFLASPVSCHPDMVLFKTAANEFICAPNCFSEYQQRLSSYGINLICGKKQLRSNYPEDIAYNILKVKDFALGRFSDTDEVLLKHLSDNGIKMISVKQGYSKCSVLSFESCAITADESLYNALCECNIDVLKIPCGEIALTGYDYGFIGGASGENSRGEIFFFGDLRSVSFGNEIKAFLISKGKTIYEIEGLQLTDVGTIMFSG